MLGGVQVGVWGEVDRSLSRTGVQSFALEGTLGELQASYSLIHFLLLLKTCQAMVICLDVVVESNIHRLTVQMNSSLQRAAGLHAVYVEASGQ